METLNTMSQERKPASAMENVPSRELVRVLAIVRGTGFVEGQENVKEMGFV